MQPPCQRGLRGVQLRGEGVAGAGRSAPGRESVRRARDVRVHAHADGRPPGRRAVQVDEFVNEWIPGIKKDVGLRRICECMQILQPGFRHLIGSKG
jgi:hypothetical protein